MALNLKRVHHISLGSTNHQRLTDFYVNVLGFEQIERGYRPYGGSWLVKGDIQVHVIEKDPNYNIPEDPSNTNGKPLSGPKGLSRGHHVAFLTDDFEGVKRKLDELGIEYYSRFNSDNWRQQVWFYDPDGNGIEVIQFNAKYKSKL